MRNCSGDHLTSDFDDRNDDWDEAEDMGWFDGLGMGSPTGMANREIHWIPGNHGLVGASKNGIHWDMSGDIERYI